MTPEERAALALRGSQLPDAFKAELVQVIAAVVRNTEQDMQITAQTRTPLQQAELDALDVQSRIDEISQDIENKPQGALADEEYRTWKWRAGKARHFAFAEQARIRLFIKHEQERLLIERQREDAERKALNRQMFTQRNDVRPTEKKQLKWTVMMLQRGLAIARKVNDPKARSYAREAYAFLKTRYPDSVVISGIPEPDGYDPRDADLIALVDRVFGDDD